MRREDAEDNVATTTTATERSDDVALRWRAQTFVANRDAIILTDADGRVLDWNPAAERLYGYTRDEILGGSTSRLYRPEDGPGLRRAIRESIERDGSWSGEITFVRKDGTTLFCETTVGPLLDDAGRIVGAFSVNRDVTERKQAEAAAAHLAAIVTSAEDAIASKTLEGIVTSWNASAERMFGYTADEMIGQPILRLFPPDTVKEEDLILARIRAGERIEHFETVRVTKDGRQIEVSLTISPIRDSAGRIIGASKIVRDITEQKAVAETLRRVQEVTAKFAAARTLGEVRGVILGDLAHALGARGAGLRLVTEAGLVLDERVMSAPMSEAVLRRVAVLAPQADHPAVEAARTGGPVFLSSADEAIQRYPTLADAIQKNGSEASAHLPLRRGEETFAVLSLDFAAPRAWDEAQRTLARSLADRAAVSYERARLFEAERDARRQLEEAGTQLERALAEAAEQARLLATTIEAMPDAAALFAADGTILLVNTAFRRLFALEAHPGFFDRPPDERRRQLGLLDADGTPLSWARSPFERVLRGGETLTGSDAVDIQAVAPDGRLVELGVVGSPIRNGDGQITGAVLLYRDITDRRQLERRTRDALEGFVAITRALMEAPDETDTPTSSPRAIAHSAHSAPLQEHIPTSERYGSPLAHRLAELTRGILSCSRVAVTAVEEVNGRLFDWPVAIVGMTPEQERMWWAEQLAARPREVGIGLLSQDRERLLKGEVLILDLTRPPYQPSETYGITALLWTAMRTRGRIVGFLALDYNDQSGQPHVFTPEEIQIAEAAARLGAVVLERERLLRERAESQARELAAVEAARRMDEFLSIASHELRTPLTTIKANVQMAERRAAQLRALSLPETSGAATRGGGRAGQSPAQVRQLSQLLGSAIAAIDRQERLVQDLLDVSRIVAGKLEYRMESFDLAALVRDVVEEQRLAAPQRTLSISLPRSPVPVYADSDRVRQVLTNYLTNALKYSSADQPVSVAVRLRRRGGDDGARSVRVDVRDAGPGLSAEQQRHIFERFHRVPGIEVRSGSGIGLGLGLYISKTIVEQHGGTVGVESVVGEGSTFWFALPLADEGTAHHEELHCS